MVDIIEGEAVEVEPQERALVPAQPGQAIVSRGATGPADMIANASTLAAALRDIVERQRLYATIQGKKYPQVEAWSTIGRMDNVVAREASKPIRQDDGSYEAEVELIRLSDGMVVGRASAICGMPDDKPWSSRPEYARRSMAVTRATSRAFRQQYSWIMALAGYEPTPADEMPHEQDAPRRDQRPVGAYDSPPDRPELERFADGLIGEVSIGKPPVDMETRQTPDGPSWGFKLTQGRKGFQALAIGPLAEVLALAGLEVGDRVTVWGRIDNIPWEKDGKAMPPYSRIAITRVQGPDWTLPAEGPVEAASEPLPFDMAAIE